MSVPTAILRAWVYSVNDPPPCDAQHVDGGTEAEVVAYNATDFAAAALTLIHEHCWRTGAHTCMFYTSSWRPTGGRNEHEVWDCGPPMRSRDGRTWEYKPPTRGHGVEIDLSRMSDADVRKELQYLFGWYRHTIPDVDCTSLMEALEASGNRIITTWTSRFDIVDEAEDDTTDPFAEDVEDSQ